MADIKAKRISDLSPKTDITPDAKLPIIDKTAGGSYDNFNMPVALLTTLAKGDTGPEGPQGPQGVQGPQGQKGDKGDTGDTGPAATVAVGTTTTGNPGTNAAVTNSGSSSAATLNFTIPSGQQGLKGDKGDKGDTGDVGPQGPIGLQGVQGPKGIQGEVGPQGPKGDQGVKGDTGAGVNIIGTLNNPSELPASGNTGDAYLISGDLYVWTGTSWENVGSIEGPTGPQGPEGPQGPQGPKGDQGIQGVDGPQGLQGIQGAPGAKGDKGDTGAAGPGVATGGTTGQILGKKSGTNYDTEWIDKPTSGVWGQITGTLSNQTDLNSVLAGKANSSHTHSTTDLTATGGTATSFLRKDNTWATPTGTTYAEITSAEITAGTASTARAITGRRAQEIVDKARTGVVKSTTTGNLTASATAPASPSTGDVWIDTNDLPEELAPTSIVWKETPAGAVNGTNMSFTTSSPYISGSLQVFVNGLAQSGFTTETAAGSGNFSLDVAPQTGDDIKVQYVVRATSLGDANSVGGNTLAAILQALFPIGSKYDSGSSATLPALIAGIGTWERFLGRVVVGVDEAQTEFNTFGKRGGAKTHTLTVGEMPSHTHTSPNGSPFLTDLGAGTVVNSAAGSSYGFRATGSATQAAGSGGSHNNLQPYETTYLWKRIS